MRPCQYPARGFFPRTRFSGDVRAEENAEKPVRDEKLLRDLGSIQEKAVHQVATRSELYLRVAVIALAVGLIIAGILNGGLEDVLAKGATICTECVGLG